MNSKLIVLLAAVVILVPVGYGAYYAYGPHEFADVYEDCYLEIQDAQSLMLKETPSHNSKSLRPVSHVLGKNVEDAYGSGGNTLYKSTLTSESEEVQMYTLDDGVDDSAGGAVEYRNYQYIDRDVRDVESLVLNGHSYTLITFYGLDSDTDSYQCYMSGYRYDPNSQLTYLVDDENGKMYNITEIYREIQPKNLVLFEVYDAHYEVHFRKVVDDVMYLVQVDASNNWNKVLALTFKEDGLEITTLATAEGNSTQPYTHNDITETIYPSEIEYFYG